MGIHDLLCCYMTYYDPSKVNIFIVDVPKGPQFKTCIQYGDQVIVFKVYLYCDSGHCSLTSVSKHTYDTILMHNYKTYL